VETVLLKLLLKLTFLMRWQVLLVTIHYVTKMEQEMNLLIFLQLST